MQALQNPTICEHKTLGASVVTNKPEMDAARAWFDATVSVYVLNLTGDADRMAFTASRLWELGVVAEPWLPFRVVFNCSFSKEQCFNGPRFFICAAKGLLSVCAHDTHKNTVEQYVSSCAFFMAITSMSNIYPLIIIWP